MVGNVTVMMMKRLNQMKVGVVIVGMCLARLVSVALRLVRVKIRHFYWQMSPTIPNHRTHSH
jgi:hypothetical protein